MTTTGEFKGMCDRCSERATCTKLCPAAEAYVNQDYTTQAELPIGLPKGFKEEDADMWNPAMGIFNRTDLRKKLLPLIKRLHESGLTQADIAKKVKIPKRTITRWLAKTSLSRK